MSWNTTAIQILFSSFITCSSSSPPVLVESCPGVLRDSDPHPGGELADDLVALVRELVAVGGQRAERRRAAGQHRGAGGGGHHLQAGEGVLSMAWKKGKEKEKGFKYCLGKKNI